MNWKIFLPVAAALVLSAVPAGANESSHYYIAKGSSCSGLRARASMLMYADTFTQTNVTNFILHARMIPHDQNLTGQNWSRTWSTTISPSVVAGATGHKLVMTTYAKVPDAEKDWDLQVKMQWKRMGRLDWNKTLTIPFNETSCTTTTAANTGGGMAVGSG